MPPLSLLERIKALMMDEDPDRAVIWSVFHSLVSFLNIMIDQILHKGSYFDNIRRFLDRHVLGIMEEVYSNLVDSVEAYLVHLGQEIKKLMKHQASGASSYITTRMESRLKACRDVQKSAKLELWKLQSRVTQMQVNITKKDKANADLLQALESRQAKIAHLEKELEEAKDARGIIEIDLAEVERARTNMREQLEPQNKKLIETEQEIAKAQSATEESLNASLMMEFEQAYTEELSKLEEKIRSYKLSLD